MGGGEEAAAVGTGGGRGKRACTVRWCCRLARGRALGGEGGRQGAATRSAWHPALPEAAPPALPGPAANMRLGMSVDKAHKKYAVDEIINELGLIKAAVGGGAAAHTVMGLLE